MTRRSSICISTSRRSDARQTTGHRHLRWLLILVVFQLSLFSASAQGFLKFQRDSIPFFRGFAVSADLVGLAQMQLGDYGQYEAALRLNLHDQYFPIVELGLGRANHQDDEVTHISYKTSAPYFRVGADVNIAKNKHAKNRIYAGLRYGYTRYSSALRPSWWARCIWVGVCAIVTVCPTMTAELARRGMCLAMAPRIRRTWDSRSMSLLIFEV